MTKFWINKWKLGSMMVKEFTPKNILNIFVKKWSKLFNTLTKPFKLSN